mgnify:CR=1 FL=1
MGHICRMRDSIRVRWKRENDEISCNYFIRRVGMSGRKNFNYGETRLRSVISGENWVLNEKNVK